MPAQFAGDGLRFDYPENWTLEEQPTETGKSWTLQSPGTAFAPISVDHSRPAVQEVLDTTLAALRDDYPELEVEPATERIGHRQARGHDIQFFSLDLSNSCWIRVVRTAERTILVMCQVSDLELEEAEPVLRAIRASIEVTDK